MGVPGLEPGISSLSGKRVIRSDFRILANELRRAIHRRPLMSVGVATGRYSVGYSPPGLTARSPGPNLLIRRFPYGHPDPFRSVRYLGLAAARCSHPSGELPARSTVWLPVAGHKSPLVLVLGRSSLDGSARPRTATKSATYGQLPAHLLRRAHLQPYATLARVVFSLIAPRPQSLLYDVSKHRAPRDHPRHIPQTGRKVQGDRSDVYVRPATTTSHTR